MKKIITSTVEALHYLFSGNPDDANEIPYKEKVRGVTLYSILVGGSIVLYWLFSQR